MPLLNIVNLVNGDLIIADAKKTFPPITVGPLLSKSVALSGFQLDAAGPVLKRLVDAGDMTYTTGNDPAVSDASEILPGAAAVADGAVTTAKIAALAVDATKLAAGAVTAAKAKVFVSAEQTATGASQSIAHGLAVTPSLVLVVPTAGHNGSGAAGIQMPTAVEGSHTSTNVLATVTQGAKFKVLAWA